MSAGPLVMDEVAPFKPKRHCQGITKGRPFVGAGNHVTESQVSGQDSARCRVCGLRDHTAGRPASRKPIPIETREKRQASRRASGCGFRQLAQALSTTAASSFRRSRLILPPLHAAC